jgi:hypothetical protein
MGAEVVRQRVGRSGTSSGEAIRPLILIAAQHPRQIQVEQSATCLLTKLRDRNLPVLGLCQATLDVFAGKAALCDENRHSRPSIPAVVVPPVSAVTLDRGLYARQRFLQVRRRHNRHQFHFRIQAEEETFSYIGYLR